LINKYNAIELSIETALAYKNLAYKNLEIFDPSPEKTMLLEILQYAVSRQN
jgi:geranylgeranyl pyrophosphate synthase